MRSMQHHADDEMEQERDRDEFVEERDVFGVALEDFFRAVARHYSFLMMPLWKRKSSIKRIKK